MSVTIKRNLIITTLATIFFFVAKYGIEDINKNGLEGLGMFPLLVGGFGFIASSVVLVVRLWGTEKE